MLRDHSWESSEGNIVCQGLNPCQQCARQVSDLSLWPLTCFFNLQNWVCWAHCTSKWPKAHLKWRHYAVHIRFLKSSWVKLSFYFFQRRNTCSAKHSMVPRRSIFNHVHTFQTLADFPVTGWPVLSDSHVTTISVILSANPWALMLTSQVGHLCAVTKSMSYVVVFWSQIFQSY